MTINFGKRNPGALTAASPGDSIYIPLQFFNDSGASIGIGSTLARTDVEIFKDGSVTQRATDSGITILGDTGNFDNRIGFKGVSISLFNTADDASFYAVGSSYWVAIDSVTVDGRTVRFWPAVFEIGEPRANVVAFNDTGVNDRLARIQSDVDTGIRSAISDVDTGLHDTIADLDTGLRALVADLDTGLRDTMADFDTGVRALLTLRDTGAIATAVWAKDARTLTGWSFDTGVQQAIARLDTGLRDTLADYDTGIRAILALQDTGAIAAAVASSVADAVWDERDTGHLDTGTFGRLRPALAAVRAKTDSLTFTVAGVADSNIQYVNDVQVGGTGDTGVGTPWGPV